MSTNIDNIRVLLTNFIMEKNRIKANGLIENINKLHTTAMGAERVKRNLQIDVDDVVQWCTMQILDRAANIEKRGKNWYVTVHGSKITVNAHSYTIITAHKVKEQC